MPSTVPDDGCLGCLTSLDGCNQLRALVNNRQFGRVASWSSGAAPPSEQPRRQIRSSDGFMDGQRRAKAPTANRLFPSAVWTETKCLTWGGVQRSRTGTIRDLKILGPRSPTQGGPPSVRIRRLVGPYLDGQSDVWILEGVKRGGGGGFPSTQMPYTTSSYYLFPAGGTILSRVTWTATSTFGCVGAPLRFGRIHTARSGRGNRMLVWRLVKTRGRFYVLPLQTGGQGTDPAHRTAGRPFPLLGAPGRTNVPHQGSGQVSCEVIWGGRVARRRTLLTANTGGRYDP
jgi:hypothetical protein